MDRGLSIVTMSPDETRILGVALAPLLLPGDVLSLSGDLGAGKTVFAQGMASALGIQDRVTSPSFTIVHEYEGRYPFVHVDVYRLNSVQEVLDLGFEELLDPGAILLVEWGEAVAPLLPPRYLEVELRATASDNDADRLVSFRPRGGSWDLKLEGMRTTAEALLDAIRSEDAPSPRFMDPHPPPLSGDTETGA
jgi:tRNA threonylcarbamoyladenosine biosynthesis protein TsaE